MKLLLKNKKFRLSIILSSINDLGEYFFNAVFVIYAANVYKSPLAVSIASFIAMLPLLFELISGLLADNTRNKKKWIYSIGWIQSMLYIISYFFIGNNSVLSFSIICIINLSSDILGSYLNNLEYTYFNKIVPQEDINEASLFNSVIYRIKSLIGPSIGVLLLSISNNNYGFITIINALTFIIYAIFIKKIYDDLENPKIAEKENIKNRIKTIFSNILNIFNMNENSENRIHLLITNILIGSISTATGQMNTASLVKNPLFNFSFSQVYLFNTITLSITAILSGLLSNDIFKNIRLKKLFELTLLSLLIKILLFSLNTDISRTLGYIFGLINFYMNIKIGAKITEQLFKNVDESRLASVNSGLQFISLGALPIVSGIMLSIYNVNSIFAWIIAILVVLINFFTIKIN